MLSGKYNVIDGQQPRTKISIKRVTEHRNMNLSALPPPPPPRKVSCEVCNESFKTAKGLATHRKRHDDESASLTNTTESVIVQQKSWACDVCNQSFDSSRGLATHRNRHVRQANEKTATELNERLVGTTTRDMQSEKHTETSANEPSLQTECNEWKNTFEGFENSENLNETSFDEKLESFCGKFGSVSLFENFMPFLFIFTKDQKVE